MQVEEENVSTTSEMLRNIKTLRQFASEQVESRVRVTRESCERHVRDT